MGPYGIERNPFPVQPVADPSLAEVLAGERWRRARDGIVGVMEKCRGGEFAVITVSGPIGTGKTHLLLHVKHLADSGEIPWAYVHYADLSRSPDLGPVLADALSGAVRSLGDRVRRGLSRILEERAASGSREAERALGLGLLERIRGRGLAEAAERMASRPELGRDAAELLSGELGVPARFLSEVWSGRVSPVRVVGWSVERLTLLSRVLGRLGLVTALAVDELWPDGEVLPQLRGLINAKIPSFSLLVALQPETSERLRERDPALWDRLVRGSARFELSQPRTYREVAEIALGYLEWAGGRLSPEQERSLERMVRVAFSQLGFDSLRDFLVLMRHAVDAAARRGAPELGPRDFVEAVEACRPHSAVPGSLSGMTFSEMARIMFEVLPDSRRASEEMGAAVREVTRVLHSIGVASAWQDRRVRLEVPSHPRGSVEADALFEVGRERAAVFCRYSERVLTTPELADAVEAARSCGEVSRVILVCNRPVPREVESVPRLSVVILRGDREAADLIHSGRLLAGGLVGWPEQERLAREWASRLRMIPRIP